MSNEIVPVRCSIVRGGTSKAIFLMNNQLPADPKAREKMILAIFGSPSLRQLDGLGGADITTSKVAIIGPPTRPDADIDYTFGQVSMDVPFVDFGGNCGNISSGVAPFAIHHGLVNAVEPETTVRIHMTNTDNILVAKVQVKDGEPCVDGDCEIGGVPGTASPIEMDWSDVRGSATGKLLPTGNAQDEIEMDGKKFSVSIVDAGNICVYVKASDFGLTGYETPAQINGDKELSARLEHLHFDHCGNDGLFPHAKFYVQKKELEFAHNPMPAFYGSYEKTVLLNGDEPCWYETRDRFIPVNGDFQLKDGIKLLLTPGHSPGSQSVAVNTERGIYLIAGDCIPLYESWEVKLNGYPVPGGILTDMKAFYQSFEKIEKESDFILPGHDYRVLDHFVYPPEVESVH